MVHDRGVEFVLTGLGVTSWRRADYILSAIQDHACGSRDFLSRTRSVEVGIVDLEPHFFEAEAEKVRRIAAVRPGDDVAPDASRSARTPVTQGATIGEAGADGIVCADRA